MTQTQPSNEPKIAPSRAPAGEGLQPLLAGLRREALRVHGGTALLGWLAAALALLGLAAVATGLGAGAWIRSAWILGTLATTGAALHFTWRRAWRQRPAELARALEDADPRARGLGTAIELAARLEDPAFPYSPDLARAHVARAVEGSRHLAPGVAFDRRWLHRSAGLAGGSALLFAVLLFSWETAATGLSQLVGAGADAGADSSPSPITGDIALTYVYPAYTGLPTRTIEGSNGEIAALPGTEVRIETRSDRQVSRAFLDVGGASLPLEVEGGRQLRGSLLLQQSGSYRFRFVDGLGRRIAEGPAIPINVTEDAAPTITLDAPVPELTVTEKEAVELSYDAGDDFGVAALELVYERADGQEQRVPLSTWAEPKKRQTGSWVWELAALDLRAGERVRYHLRVQDNDTVSGPKWGQSRAQVLVVFSPSEHRRELTAKVEEAWERMILALGDRIEPREGPRKVEGVARIDAGAKADEAVAEVTRTLQSLAAELREDELAPAPLVAAISNLATQLAPKAQATRSLRARARVGGTSRQQLLARLDEAEKAEQRELEQGILYLESMLDRQRLQEIEEISRELADGRRELANLIERYQEAPGDEARQAILREVARLRERMTELLRRMSDLGKGIRDEHLNAEAMKALSQERDLLGQLDEVEKLVEEGKLDEALAELQKLALQMEQMSQAIEEAMDGHVENDPALAELMEAIEDYDKDLAAVEQEQEELAKATEQLRREQSQALQQRLAEEGQDLVSELRRMAAQASGHLSSIPAFEIHLNLADELLGALERLRDLDASLSSRDFDAALESVALALAHAEGLSRTFDQEKRIAERYRGGLPEGFSSWQGEAAEALPLIVEVKERLEKLFADPARQMQPRQRDQSQRLAQRQQELGQRMEALQQQARAIGEQAPLFDDGSFRVMEQTGRSMGEAEGRLRSLDPGGALASERSAQEGLKSLREGLEQAKEQARSNRGGGGFPMPMAGGGKGGKGGGRGGGSHEKVAIPDQHKAPEAYRKEILDAMKRDAPEGFQEPVRDYYQEIVK